MAERALLRKKSLTDFMKWLTEDGWTIEPIKSKGFTYEVLRARKTGRKNPLMVYDRNNAKEHYSILDRDASVIFAYLKAKKTK